jgi:hypothetical protein
MIEKIRAINWRSHKDSSVELSSGITAICGDSDSGKTAFLHAFNQVVTNTPLGVRFVDDIKKPSQVIVVAEGHEVERGRRGGKTGKAYYRLGDDLFEALKRDIPEEISQLLMLDTVNTQGQLEHHFMLQMPSPKAGKMLSQLAGFDDMFRLLDEISTIQNEARGEKKSAIKDIARLDNNVKNLIPVPPLLERGLEIKTLADKIDEDESEAETLMMLVEDIKACKKEIVSPHIMGEFITTIKKLEELLDDSWLAEALKNLTKGIVDAESSMVPEIDYLEAVRVVEDLDILLVEAKKADEILEIVENLKDLEQDKFDAEDNVKKAISRVVFAENKLKKAWEKLGNCPTCGQDLTDSAIENLMI